MVKVDVFGIVWWPCQKKSSAKVPGKKRDFGRITRFWIIAKVNFAYVFENYAFLACRQCIFWIRVREIRLFLMPDYQGASGPAWTKFRLFGRGDF